MQFYPFTQQQQQQQHGVYEMSITFCSQCIDSLFVAVAADAAVNNVAQSRRERVFVKLTCAHVYNIIIISACVCARLYFSVHHLIMTLISLEIVVYLALFSHLHIVVWYRYYIAIVNNNLQQKKKNESKSLITFGMCTHAHGIFHFSPSLSHLTEI